MSAEAANLQAILQSLEIDYDHIGSPCGYGHSSDEQNDPSTSGVSETTSTLGGEMWRDGNGWAFDQANAKTETLARFASHESWVRCADHSKLGQSVTAPAFGLGGTDHFVSLMTATQQQSLHDFRGFASAASHNNHLDTAAALADDAPPLLSSPLGDSDGSFFAAGAGAAAAPLPPTQLDLPFLPDLQRLIEKNKEREAEAQRREEAKQLQRAAQRARDAELRAARAAEAAAAAAEAGEDAGEEETEAKKKRRRRRKPKKARKAEAYWKNAPGASECMIVPFVEGEEEEEEEDEMVMPPAATAATAAAAATAVQQQQQLQQQQSLGLFQASMSEGLPMSLSCLCYANA